MKNVLREIFLYLSSNGYLRWVPDKYFIKIQYRINMGKNLNLDNPVTFNEKLQWLKLYDRKPIYTMMVDKYEVKKYVADIIGEQYLIPTLGIWDNFDDIDFDSLPEQFVLKCTHDSGGLVVCRDKKKLDKKKAKKKISSSLKRNYYWLGREWPYKNVKPRIIAEKYIENKVTHELLDYKFMCYNGKVQNSFVCSDRHTSSGLKVTFHDIDWNKMPFERHYPNDIKHIPKPKNYEKMIELAEILSERISFVRIDFYETDYNLYFGEMTFYPGSGIEEFNPDIWDRKLGDLIKLPETSGGGGVHDIFKYL